MSLPKRAANFIFDLLFPIKCLGCGAELENEIPQKRWICPDCLGKIDLRKEQVCPVCEKESEGGRTHYACRKETALDGLWASSWYDSKLIAEAIHKFKFNFIKDLSFPLAHVMERSLLGANELTDIHDLLLSGFSKMPGEENIYVEETKNRISETVIIPVPLHRKRYNWRGFNQSYLLSSRLAEKFKISASDKLLAKRKNTKPQTQLSAREDRKANIKGAFYCPDASLVVGKNFVVVDDVCTTLSTLNECALELKKAKAKNIWGLVIARR